MAAKTAWRGAVPSRLLHSPGVRFLDDLHVNEAGEVDFHLSMVQSNLPMTDSGAPSPDLPPGTLQPASLRLRITEQRLKLLNAINVVLQQRAELEASRVTLTHLHEELKKKLKRRVDDCESAKKDKLKTIKTSNQTLETERNQIVQEIDHLRRHLDKETEHHQQHARAAQAQAAQGAIAYVTKGAAAVTTLTKGGALTTLAAAPVVGAALPSAVSRSVARAGPSRKADNKLAAARLIKEITELRQRVSQIEGRLHAELKRKKQAESDISMLRAQLLNLKAECAAARHPLAPLRTNRYNKL